MDEFEFDPEDSLRREEVQREKYGEDCRHCGRHIEGDDPSDECETCRWAWDSLLTD